MEEQVGVRRVPHAVEEIEISKVQTQDTEVVSDTVRKGRWTSTSLSVAAHRAATDPCPQRHGSLEPDRLRLRCGQGEARRKIVSAARKHGIEVDPNSKVASSGRSKS